MFGKKKDTPKIDPDQLRLIKNAEKRIKQKRNLFNHFVIFLIGSVALIIANTLLGIGQDVQFFGKDWFVYAIIVWALLFLYHAFKVFVTNQFMSKEWEQNELNRLVNKQKEKIKKLQITAEKNNPLPQPNMTTVAKKTSNKQACTMIVATGENNVIGKDNQLIWHLSDDLKRFKSLTNGHHIIMGRKTFESFPKPLPNRTHIVITRQESYRAPEGVIIVNSLEEAMKAVKNDSEPYIIGGGEIYKQGLAIATKIELTRVHANFEGDTYFPVLNKDHWKETENIFHKKDNKHDFEFSFITYVRK